MPSAAAEPDAGGEDLGGDELLGPDLRGQAGQQQLVVDLVAVVAGE